MVGKRRQEHGVGLGRTRMAGRTAGGRHRRQALGLVEHGRRGQQRRAVEVGVLDDDGRAGRAQGSGVGALVPTGVRVGHHDERPAKRRRLSQRRRAGSTEDEVRGHERVGHLVPQEGHRSVSLAHLGRQCLAASKARGVAVVTGHMQDGRSLDQLRQRRGDRVVQPSDGLGATEDEQDATLGGQAQACSRGLGFEAGERAHGRARQVRPPGQLGRGRQIADGDDRGQAGHRPHAAAGHKVALPEQARDAQEAGRQEDRDGHVATGGVDHTWP